LEKDNPFDENKDYYLMKKPFVNEFGYLLSVGIGYRFEPKKKMSGFFPNVFVNEMKMQIWCYDK
jgi:hypothetical protein